MMTRFVMMRNGEIINTNLIGRIRDHDGLRGYFSKAFDCEGRELGLIHREEADFLYQHSISRLVPVPKGWNLLRSFNDSDGDLFYSEPIIAFEVGQFGNSRAITCSEIVQITPTEVVLRPDGVVDCGGGNGSYPNVEAWKQDLLDRRRKKTDAPLSTPLPTNQPSDLPGA